MKKILITGGAGFIGINTAEYFLRKGDKVTILDNFSRKGSRDNLGYLKEKYEFKAVKADVRYDYKKLDKYISDVDIVFHLAAQVAVTSSVKNPRYDFRTNAFGTFNVLEAVRKSKNKPILLYSSTNKVYGEMKNIKVIERDGRYEYNTFENGCSENQQLDFHSPYGCSKGTADQYVIDYSRIYGLKTVVFRQSCIYGKHQFGNEDQAWISWFAIANKLKKPITIYGDGKQIRDVLYVDDLVRAYDLATSKIDKTNGKAYNIGGGPGNTLSLLELCDILGIKKWKYDDWRPGDQKVFVSDVSKAKKEFGWEPSVKVKEGVNKLVKWIEENKKLFK